MFLRSTVFCLCALLEVFTPVGSRSTHLMHVVRAIVDRMGNLEASLPDVSGASKVDQDGHFTYTADFECTNGTIFTREYTLMGGPAVTGNEDAVKLEFAVNLGYVTGYYEQCYLYSGYPETPGGPAPNVSEISGQILDSRSTLGICTIAILQAGTSCSISPSFVLKNITVDAYWGAGGAATIAGNVNSTLQSAMIPVLYEATREIDLCYLLD